MGADHRARTAGQPAPSISGRVSVHRARFARFPAFELQADGGLKVEMGRYSALNIYFGWGQRLVLPTGPAWRVIAVQKGSMLHPVVLNETRQRLAMASPWVGNYGINGRDYAYTLNPAEAARFGRSGRWDLFRGEDRVASFTRRPFGADCGQPLPLPAVLLALLLTRLSIPGEADMQLPQMRWG
ncbi:MAG: hypothetical protein H6Q11_484 [Acidobacteria bacterium]|nr:hypothetical protein [Acidobacteriota bacterium]